MAYANHVHAMQLLCLILLQADLCHFIRAGYVLVQHLNLFFYQLHSLQLNHVSLGTICVL